METDIYFKGIRMKFCSGFEEDIEFVRTRGKR